MVVSEIMVPQRLEKQERRGGCEYFDSECGQNIRFYWQCDVFRVNGEGEVNGPQCFLQCAGGETGASAAVKGGVRNEPRRADSDARLPTREISTACLQLTGR